MDIIPNPVGQVAGLNCTHLAQRLRIALNQGGLTDEREQIGRLADELGVQVLDCAAALLYLLQQVADKTATASVKPILPAVAPAIKPTIKMVRYRLDIGSRHQLYVETLKKLLVEESGVDKNNINNINIHGLYTLIELPDAMPPDIFQHLKWVEINGRQLDIKRVKGRNKKRAKARAQSGKPAAATSKAAQAKADQAVSKAI